MFNGFLGACAGVSASALATIAIDSSLESQTLAGGYRLHNSFAAGAMILCGALGLLLGLAKR